MIDPLLPLVASKAGSYGVHWYEASTYCCAKAEFMKDAPPNIPDKYALICGLYYHVLHEVRSKNKLGIPLTYNFEVDQFEHANYMDKVALGKRKATSLYNAYVADFGFECWDVIDAEVELKLSGEIPFRGRLDAIVQVKPKHVKHIERLRGVYIEPGWYVIDYKTSHNGLEPACYTESMQCFGYQLLFEEHFPRKKFQGMLYDEALKCHKTPEFRLHHAPVLSVNQRKEFYEWLETTCQAVQGRNLAHCMNYGEMCPFFSKCRKR